MPSSAHPLSHSAAPPEAASGLAGRPPDSPAVDPRLSRLPQLFRDSRAAGEVHPLEHVMRRYFTGDRA